MMQSNMDSRARAGISPAVDSFPGLTCTFRSFVIRLHAAAGILAALALLALAAPSLAADTEARTALVIGNGAYDRFPLDNPVNDANDVAEVLRDLGFDVMLHTDIDRRQMSHAVRDFGKRLRNRGGVGIFYYAGHGMQIDSRNYLIPVNNSIETADEVPFESLDVNRVLAKMETAGNALNLLLLDACRDNPFPSRYRGNNRGLARVDAPIGSLVVYATAPGSVAADGDGRNGIFTRHLLENLRQTDLSLTEMIRLTRAAVVKETGGEQIPWESSSLLNDYYFIQGRDNKPGQTAALTSDDFGASEDDWTEIVSSSLRVDTVPDNAHIRIMNSAEVYQPGMSLNTEKEYDILVTHDGYQQWRQKIRLEPGHNRIQVHLEQLDDLDTPVSGKPEQLALNEENENADNEGPPLIPADITIPHTLRISGGIYSMGCSSDDNNCNPYEKPVEELRVSDFMMGATEITVGQFREFVEATDYVTDAERNADGHEGCYIWYEKGGINRSSARWGWVADRNWRNPGYSQSNKHPVTCVSWNDALAYADWLGSVTGRQWRLPTEAEWEYAARAGSNSRFPSSDTARELCLVANVADKSESPGGSRWSNRVNCHDKYWFSAPVGSYMSNAFGLYDMQGNVWEWVEDIWQENRAGNPDNDSTEHSSESEQRVLRGGAWDGDAEHMRISNRSRSPASSRAAITGFRLVTHPDE
ncbi:MAG: hypothetical protein CSB44_04300 [Gammaproteobacteria bacterium]|nr:MAG: hypothetical protein CSB44_04300 [Gammaproteobacteria bacterium]